MKRREAKDGKKLKRKDAPANDSDRTTECGRDVTESVALMGVAMAKRRASRDREEKFWRPENIDDVARAVNTP